MSDKSLKTKPHECENKRIINNNNRNEDHDSDADEDMDTNDSLSENIVDNDCHQLSDISVKSNVMTGYDQNSSKTHKPIEIATKRDNDLIKSNKKDEYCWDCHKDSIDYSCKSCPRSYHQKCPSLKNRNTKSKGIPSTTSCPECEAIMLAEDESNPKGLMSGLKGGVNHLSQLLTYMIETVKHSDRNKNFSKPVSLKDYPDYRHKIVNPMDLNTIENNIKQMTYGSTNSFLTDVKWIYHNCVVYNGISNNAYVNEARNVIRVAKQECEEIEICPDCYNNYYSLDEIDYFAATCSKPHAIVWAKLSGHPFWPAKVVRYDAKKDQIDVRFFGTHDKCWLRPENCYFISKEYPNQKKPSKLDEDKFNCAIRDMNSHFDQLDLKFPQLFKFHDKCTVFTVDKLYLTQIGGQSEDSGKSFNGFKMKNLSICVNTSKFDMNDESRMLISDEHSNQECDSSEDMRPPNKKSKRSISSNSSNCSPKPKTNRCISRSIPIRQAFDSPQESIKSSVYDNNDSEVERSVDLNLDHNSADDGLNSDCGDNESIEVNDRMSDISNNSRQTTASQTNMKTVTVLGKSTDILHINRNNETMDVRNESIESSNRDIDRNPANDLNNENVLKTKKTINANQLKRLEELERQNKELKVKLKTVEIRLKKVRDEKTKIECKLIKCEEDKEEMKLSLEEFQKNTDDIKRKQWCNACMKEAILPCCWNTCYCTVECQHKHWPIHARTCRRKQMTAHHSDRA